MTYLWDTVALSPFESLQAVVAARHGPEWALSLSAWKHLYSLRITDGGAPIADAFGLAADDLLSWCRRGQVTVYGRRQIGPYSFTESREAVGEAWNNSHCFDFDRSLLNGDPRYDRLTMRGDDVRRLAKPEEDSGIPQNRRRGALPNHNWSAVEALAEVEISRRGPLDEEGPPDWRCRADLERFMADEMAKRGSDFAKETYQRHAQAVLDRLRPIKAGK